jgi:hypothetical protein
MRREPEQKTVRERDEKPRERREEPKKREASQGHKDAYMRGHRDGKMGKPANPGDPQRGKGDGMKEAEGSRKDGGTEKGRPSRPADPQKGKGDGMKVAMRGEAGKRSALTDMRAAEQRVR